MNERIKELRHEASLWCDANIPDQWDEEVGYGIAWQDKVAELIVLECANLNFYSTGEVTHDGAEIIGDMIKKHFGVEE